MVSRENRSVVTPTTTNYEYLSREAVSGSTSRWFVYLFVCCRLAHAVQPRNFVKCAESRRKSPVAVPPRRSEGSRLRGRGEAIRFPRWLDLAAGKAEGQCGIRNVMGIRVRACFHFRGGARQFLADIPAFCLAICLSCSPLDYITNNPLSRRATIAAFRGLFICDRSSPVIHRRLQIARALVRHVRAIVGRRKIVGVLLQKPR